MIHFATTQQMAGMLTEAPKSHPAPKFYVMQNTSGVSHLRLSIDNDQWALSATREPRTPRTFATIAAAVRQAQAISIAAGFKDDHEWTGSPQDLPAMPEISVYLTK